MDSSGRGARDGGVPARLREDGRRGRAGLRLRPRGDDARRGRRPGGQDHQPAHTVVGVPYVKGLADFDWDFQPSVPRAEIDELGYLDVGSAGADLLLRLISARYEQRSTIITADVGIGGWGRVFGDDVAASAIADRVCRHCHLVKITGRSYRLLDLPRDGPVKP